MIKDELHSTDYWEDFYTKCKPSVIISHLDVLDTLEANPEFLDSYYSLNWIMIAMHFNRPVVVKLILDYYNVPENLTLKEQLCWIQLIGHQ